MMRGSLDARSRAATIALVLVTWVAVVVALWPAHGKILSWDEVNYANAAKAGIIANAVERGSLSPVDWLRFAFAKQTGTEPTLPSGYDEATDPLILRFHPPFVVYLIAAIAGDQIPIDEHRVRAAQLLGALALIAVVTAAYRSLSSAPTIAGYFVVALLSAWLCLQLFVSVSLHGWFAVWIVVTAMLLARWLEKGTTMRAAAVGCSLGAALLTLESAVVLWLGVALAYLLRRRLVPASTATRRQLVVACAVGVAVVLLAWPGTVVSISLIKLAAMLFYRVRLGQEYADIAIWLPRSSAALLPTLVMVPLAAVVLWRLGAPRPHWRVYALLCAIYAAAFARFAIQPEYTGPASAAAIPVVGVAAGRLGRWPATLFAATALLTIAAIPPERWPDGADPWRADIDWLREQVRGRPTLVDGAHIVRYYLGSAYDLEAVTQSYDLSILQARRNGRYEDLGRSDVAGKIVVLKVRQSSESRIERDLLAGCVRTDRATIRLFDCSAVSSVQPSSD